MKKFKRYLILSALTLMVLAHPTIKAEASDPVLVPVSIASVSLDSSGYYYIGTLDEYPAELNDTINNRKGVEYKVYTKGGKVVYTGYTWDTECEIFGTSKGQTYYVRARSFLDSEYFGGKKVYSDWSAKKYFTSKEKTGASTYTVTTVTDSEVNKIHDKMYAHKEGFTLKVKGNLATSRKTLAKLQTALAKKNTYHVMFAIDGWRDMSSVRGKVKNGYTYYDIKLSDAREYYWAIVYGKKAFEYEKEYLKPDSSVITFNGKKYSNMPINVWTYMDMANLYETDYNYIMKLDDKALDTLREAYNRVVTKKFYQLSPTERFDILMRQRDLISPTGEASSGEVRYDWTTLRYLAGKSDKYGYGVCRHQVKTTFYVANVFGVSTEYYYLPIDNHAYGIIWLKDSSGANKWTIVEGAGYWNGATIGCAYSYSDSDFKNGKLNKKSYGYDHTNKVVNALKKKYPSAYKRLKVSNIFFNWRDGFTFLDLSEDTPKAYYFGKEAGKNAPKLVKYNIW